MGEMKRVYELDVYKPSEALSNMVNSGGEAKYVISEGQVIINGKVETRKRKKIFSGDVVEFGNEDRRTDGRFLYIEPKVDDISVCYRISLAFKANPALFFCLPVTSGIHEILICNNFRPYEAPLDI